MNYLKDYRNMLKIETDDHFKNYHKKTFTLKCNDTKQEQTHIYFSIYYTHCNYEIYVEGLKIKELEKGHVKTFTSNKGLKFKMPYTSYRFSKKQFEQAENFIKTNIFQLLQTYCEINKNISID